jgi:hypothetical protein
VVKYLRQQSLRNAAIFTVKHYRRGGQVAVCLCDTYEYQPESPLTVEMFHKTNGASFLDIGPGDSVFIENPLGRTVTAIRPKD